ncbi:MAG TPA: DUF3489 domain-containing protein [Rhizomicrobium sp.]|nr:DUF3489 domain-containing protein [Rhizomicrobium sp.]
MSKTAKKVGPKSPGQKPAAQQRKSRKTSGQSASLPGSKHDQIPALLRRKQGASLEEMQKATGWQTHSVRGFLSGIVKKCLGLKLQSSISKDGGRRYAVTG